MYEDSSVYSNKFQINLRELLKFESIGLYGRLFLSRKPRLRQNEPNFLHLGCGGNKIENWVNADFFMGLKFWKNYHDRPDWMLDLRFPLNCDNNIWDGVFSEHTLEHLYPDRALNLLKELYRTMKPGAWLRITVPDLKKYINFYSRKEGDREFLQWNSGCEAIRALSQNWGHVSLWDSELLGRFLAESGFVKIQEVSFKEGADRVLLQDLEARKWETLYMEAQKP
jgi:predicted SAM-dependent methyltransferase